MKIEYFRAFLLADGNSHLNSYNLAARLGISVVKFTTGSTVKIIILASLAVLTGCAAVPPDQMPITTEQREFVYDYAVPGRSQSQLYQAAREYMATAYGDSRAVSRVDDEAQGTIIGRALLPWNFSTGSFVLPTITCANHYDVIFIAKEGRARLQLALKEGAMMPATCAWALPPKRDYAQIPAEFDRISKGFGAALQGNGKLDSLRQF